MNNMSYYTKDFVTEEGFNNLLHGLNKRDPELSMFAIKILSHMYEPKFDAIPSYMKNSLIRKVLRYVANYALTHTEEDLDKFAYEAGFASMWEGYPVSIRDYEKEFTARGVI